jgi:DNA replication protein DnaC
VREYDRVARQCAVEDVDYPRYLLRMTELELLDRERRAIERRIRQAKFPVTKSLDSFDFLAMPTLNKAMVLELARCEFLVRNENVLLLGNSATGKTHIALALGLSACQHGHRVRFTTASALRDAQPTLRAWLDDGHKQPALCGQRWSTLERLHQSNEHPHTAFRPAAARKLA